MTEGTKIREFDEQLGTLELKINEISNELSKTRGEHTKNFVDMDNSRKTRGEHTKNFE